MTPEESTPPTRPKMMPYQERIYDWARNGYPRLQVIRTRPRRSFEVRNPYTGEIVTVYR